MEDRYDYRIRFRYTGDDGRSITAAGRVCRDKPITDNEIAIVERVLRRWRYPDATVYAADLLTINHTPAARPEVR